MESAIDVRDSVYRMFGGLGRLEAYLLREIAKNMIKVSEFGLQVGQKEEVWSGL